MSVIGEAALSAFFQVLFTKIGSLNLKRFFSEQQVHKEIEKWDKTLKMISAVLADAERKQMQNLAVQIWLADLKDLAYDVDDILDEFATKALELNLMKEHHDQAISSKILQLFTVFLNNNDMMSKMKKITIRLESLAAQKSELQLTDQNGVNGEIPKLPESSSLVDETAIYGRQKDKDEILDLLLSTDDNISVIPIVGVGGIGKTTLAQLVYNDDSIKDRFHPRAWVCVSNEFNVVNITKTIFFSVSSRPCVENDLNSLQVKLKKMLSGKKFLLVLDDVWNENYGDWDVLKRPFAAGAPGSKVIVTTRNSKVSSLMRTVPNHHLLQKLSDDDSLCILAHHALGATDFSGHSELEVIGREIMRKCDGLPLATKTIGGLLRNNFNREAWQHILESQVWNLAEDKNHIMPALRLSYYHLPSRLKQCFACCSLIPKDYEFEEEEIISLWMADGFLHQTNTKLSSEDFCRQNFEELVSRSFFQATSKEKSKFIMHDLINELAQSVAQGFYFRMEEYQQMKIPSHTRHISVRDYVVGFQQFQNNYEAKHLRTFHSFRKPSSSYLCLSHNIVTELMSKLKYLRVLSLKKYEIYEIPNSIGNLIHLRCLDFSYTRIKYLPDSICNLYNLEILKLRGCGEIRKLPSKIGILVDLCHLDISCANSIQEMPSGIGRLTNLQVLSNFIVGQRGAANIREMQDLSGLKGKLSISELQNVKEAKDAFEAKMSHKAGVSDLKLEWSRNFDENLRKIEVEMEVFSFLEPHKELKSLTISYYVGLTFPTWIAVPSFEVLQSLTLEGCWNCTSLPAVGKLPLLKDLCIKGMNGVTRVGIEFYGENLTNAFSSLESLHFEDMEEWKEWKACKVDEQGKFFHRLRKLHIIKCPKLVEVFSMNGFCSLEELHIHKCEELKVSISALPKLSALKIDGCKEFVVSGSYNLFSVKEVFLSNISVESLNFNASWWHTKWGWLAHLESLSVLKIKGCPEVLSVGATKENVNASWWHTKWWLAALESLSVLKIEGCPEVVSAGATKIEEEEKEGHLQLNISCNIRLMRIEDCACFKKFCNLRCLSQLEITNCGELVSIDRNSLPPTLKFLEIDSCENVKYMNFSSTSLECLVFKHCKALKWLPSNGELPRCLKSLDIVDCSELELVAVEIGTDACLDSISISECKKLKELPCLLDKLSSLCSIDIRSCPELERLPESGSPTYTNLKSMVLEGCKKLHALPELCSLLQLKVLEIHGCPELESTFSDSSFGLPTNLVKLTVGGSDMSKAVMEWGLDRLNSLEKLTILSEWFPRDKSDIEMKLPASLTSLSFGHLKNVEKISSNTFQNLTCLQTLSIDNCPKLKSLPKKKMLPSLKVLRILECPELKKRCQRDKGKLWSNITHIPEVCIDNKIIYE